MNDYLLFLEENGITPEQIQQALNAAQEPLRSPGVEVLPSGIHGFGAFMPYEFQAGLPVQIAKIGNLWTQLGRFANHQKDGNMFAENVDGDIWFVAKRTISPMEELTINYRDVKEALK